MCHPHLAFCYYHNLISICGLHHIYISYMHLGRLDRWRLIVSSFFVALVYSFNSHYQLGIFLELKYSLSLIPLLALNLAFSPLDLIAYQSFILGDMYSP